MAIPKKGSRRIVVDGASYRWRVRGKPTYSQANTWAGLNLAVELEDVAGSILVVRLTQPHPSNWMNAEAPPVLPSEVERLIRLALVQGWNPRQHGDTFHLMS